MIFAACLGVGPGNALLLGTDTPGTAYRSPTEWRLHAPIETKVRTVRLRRSKADSDALRKRVVALLEAGTKPCEIAKREGITNSYVQWIKATLATHVSNQTRLRTRAENDAIVAKARRLRLQFPSMKQADIAAQCGVTPSNLCQLMARRAAA